MFQLQREIKHIVGMRLSYNGLKQPMRTAVTEFIYSHNLAVLYFKLKGDSTHVLLCVTDVYLDERLKLPLISVTLQSCGILSRTTNRRSRWTRATRPSSSATSRRASPRLRSATASNKSGWKHPKVLIFSTSCCALLPLLSSPFPSFCNLLEH